MRSTLWANAKTHFFFSFSFFFFSFSLGDWDLFTKEDCRRLHPEGAECGLSTMRSTINSEYYGAPLGISDYRHVPSSVAGNCTIDVHSRLWTHIHMRGSFSPLLQWLLDCFIIASQVQTQVRLCLLSFNPQPDQYREEFTQSTMVRLSTPTQVIPPAKLAHVVLRTRPESYEQLIQFYKTFLGGRTSFKGDSLTLIAYDDEDHRVAIVKMPGLAPKDPRTCGLHVCYLSLFPFKRKKIRKKNLTRSSTSHSRSTRSTTF